eukprot:m.176111 g.176111  ORF g.176111 m.176111 type:complete len:498 (-) comp53337_c0_seq1:215-1708(-)
MALVCALSGEVPEDAVVSPASGCVFERRLIEKHLADNETDPISNTPLKADQLISVKVSGIVRPRAPNATSIPSLIKLFQDEWDATVAESFQLRKQVEQLRQELSHSLYQHDAACRVIARLTRERDQARQALATFQASAAASAVSAGMDTTQSASADTAETSAAAGIPPAVIEKIMSNSKELSGARRKRTKPDDLASSDDIKAFKVAHSFAGLHSASNPGITALDICPNNNDLVLTGGQDKNVVLFDRKEEKVTHTFKGHTKRVNAVIIHPTADVALSASADSTVRIWATAGSFSERVIKSHDASVTGISLHPTGEYFVSASENKSWSFVDLETGSALSSIADPDAGLTSVQFHPDGVIFASGAHNSIVRIWDLRETASLAVFEGHQGSITTLAFSENGYYLATGAQDMSVKLWDLRKLKNFKTLSFDEGYQVNSVDFDNSGTYLAVAGSDLRVFTTKQWDHLATFNDHAEPITRVKFGTLAKSLVTASLDRHVKVFA